MDLSEQPTGPHFLRHPWELAKRNFVARLVRSSGLASAPLRLLDAGAGDGWLGRELLRGLPEESSLISWDIHYAAASAPSRRHRLTPTLGNGDVGDLLLALDVLEHVDDPRAWLSDLVAHHLAAGGRAIISVPAWPFLFGPHDRALGHHCRFHPDTIRRLIVAAGLEPLCGGGLFLSLLPVRMALNVMSRLFGRGTEGSRPDDLEWRWGRLTHGLTAGALALDGRIALALARRRVRVPGLSWWALCRKI